ncbi:hypothetical protein P4S72_17370 [Vibrio sp. PP-XX7]
MLIVFIGYFSFKNSSVNNYTDKLTQQAALISSGVEQKILRYFDVLSMSGNTIEVDSNGHLNESQLTDQLKFMEGRFEIVAAFFGLADGVTYRKDGMIAHFNAKEANREWYHRAMHDEKYIITKPYKASSGRMIMSLVEPVKRDGKNCWYYWCEYCVRSPY